MTTCWQILRIQATSDTGQIKKAYAKLAKQCRPEDDAMAFHTLRQAYEQALEMARWQSYADLDEAAADDADAAPVNTIIDAVVKTPLEANQEEALEASQNTSEPFGAPSEIAVDMAVSPSEHSIFSDGKEAPHNNAAITLVSSKVLEAQVGKLLAQLSQSIRDKANDAVTLAQLDAIMRHDGMNNIQIADKTRHHLVWLAAHEELASLTWCKEIFERLDLRSEVNLARANHTVNMLGLRIERLERWRLFVECAEHRHSSAEHYLLNGAHPLTFVGQAKKARMIDWLNWFRSEDPSKLELLHAPTVNKVSKQLALSRPGWWQIAGAMLFLGGFAASGLRALLDGVFNYSITQAQAWWICASIIAGALYFLPEIIKLLQNSTKHIWLGPKIERIKNTLNVVKGWWQRKLTKPLVLVELAAMVLIVSLIPWLDRPSLETNSVQNWLLAHGHWLIVIQLNIWVLRGRLQSVWSELFAAPVNTIIALLITVAGYLGVSSHFTSGSNSLFILLGMVFMDRVFANAALEFDPYERQFVVKHHSLAISSQWFRRSLAVLTVLFAILFATVWATNSIDLSINPAPWLVTLASLLAWGWATEFLPQVKNLQAHAGSVFAILLVGSMLALVIKANAGLHNFWIVISVGLLGLGAFWLAVWAVAWRRRSRAVT
jgi:hypothetical protein